MRVAFYTLGCKVNQYETEVLSARFAAEGFDVVPGHAPGCDVYVVGSCTVTAEGDRKTRQAVRRFRRENPGAIVVLTGCYPQAFPREAAARRRDFAGYQINRELMAETNPGCMVQHCLPAHRGEEITADVFEEHAEEIFDEAENRLHAQKAVMYLLMGGEE